MKRLIILICLFILATENSQAQFWNKPNAQYTFQWSEQFSGVYLGFKQLTIDSDTLIGGKSFTRYYNYSVSYLGGTNSFDPIYFDTTSVLTSIAFYEEDSVLYGHLLEANSYIVDTLYNFKALPGESWNLSQIYLDSSEFSSYYCDSVITVTVLDTGHIEIQSVPLYYLSVEYSGFQVYSDSGLTVVRDTIFERFGSKVFSFLSIPNYCGTNAPFADGGIIYNLNCYSDIEISFGQNCTFLNVPTNVNEAEQISPIIYPNPANATVRVRTSSKQVWFTNIFGQLIFSTSVRNNSVEIDIANLPNGTYFIGTDDQGVEKFVIQH